MQQQPKESLAYKTSSRIAGEADPLLTPGQDGSSGNRQNPICFVKERN